MRKKMPDAKADPPKWSGGKPRGSQETMRSFSAPHVVRDPPVVSGAGRTGPAPARSLSAQDRPSLYREPEPERGPDDGYNFAYCDVTSPSDEEAEAEDNRDFLVGAREAAEARRVVAALLPGSGLQRAQLRPAVRSFNTRVRDLASVVGGLPPPAPAPAPARQKPSRWAVEDFKNGAPISDSPDLMDHDEVGGTLRAAERRMRLGARRAAPGAPAASLKSRPTSLQQLGLSPPQPASLAALAVQESDDEVAEFPTEVSAGGDMAALMENLKKSSLARQAQMGQMGTIGQMGTMGQLNTAQASSLSQAVTSSTTQMVSNTSTSSSLSRLHLTSSEMKTNSMKSDLSELKNSISEMKNLSNAALSFNNLRNSMENLVDAVDPDSDMNEPLVTYPDPDTPPPGGTVELSNPHPLDHMLSTTSSSLDTVKFEQKSMSSASKTKLVSEGYTAEEAVANSQMKRVHARDVRFQENRSAAGSTQRMAAGTVATERSAAFKQEQRTLKSGELTQQEASNMAASSMKVQTDSYSSKQEAVAQQQARQTVTSSGVFSQEKHVAQSNISMSMSSSTKSSVISAAQMSLMNGTQKSNEEDLLNLSFDDLDRLCAESSAKDVEKAIVKYSSRLDAFVKGLKKSQGGDMKKASDDLNKINEIIRRAWAVPTHGHELGYSLCNALRNCGGLDLLMMNCVEGNGDLQYSSAQLLEQCLTTENRAHVVENGLEKVVNVACVCTKNANSSDHSRVGTGILEHLFKHSEGTCSDVIRLGGLDAVLFECRKNDIETLRHCAGALANLSLYGGAENQEAMIKRKVPMWLFPLAFHNDDNIKYYACLAIAVLVANTEIEAAVLKSGTLDLVEPFVTSHNPSEFARSNLAHAHGQSKNWLQRLVPVLSSKREEARNLAAFHFCMEAGIKKQQGNTEIFRQIGAIEPLKKVASCPNAVASKYAAQALRLIGEELPHKLSQQVPLWSTEDVKEWVRQIGFSECANNFLESRVDGDLLLQLTETNLKEDIGLVNGIRRRRFTRELQNLKKMADYSSRDAFNLNTFLQNIGPEYSIYTYSMLNAGVDKDSIRGLNDEQLENECGIINSIHRLRILNCIRESEITLSNLNEENLDKSLDVFVSYRRSNGSQLASLLKVHLQLRGFSVFIDVERLEAGKFDNNLLQSIRQAKHFLLVLTPKALDRCITDGECKDWVHREIVAALQSQCNIIPIIDNFAWPEPEDLPEDMRQVCHFNGVRWIHDYQDACVDKLERFMRGELKEAMLGRGGGLVSKEGTNPPSTPAPLVRAPPSYQRMHSSDSSKGSDKDQANGLRD